MKTFKTFTLWTLSLVMVLGIAVAHEPKVSAASLATQLTVEGSCTSKATMSSGSTSVTVAYGESSNITVENDDPVVPQNVTGPGISTQLDPSPRGTTSNNYVKTFTLGAITTQVTLTFTPVPTDGDPAIGSSCPTGSTPHASTVVITPSAPPTHTSQTQSTQSTSSSSAATPTKPDQLQVSEVLVAGKKVDPKLPVVVRSSQVLKLSGHTVANGVISLTIHSTPQTATTTANTNGDWTYTVKNLKAGNHYVEAAVTDPATKQVSDVARLVSFKVLAVTTAAPVSKTAPSNTKWIIISLVVLVLLVLGAALLLLEKRKRRLTNHSADTVPLDDANQASVPSDHKED